jgi:stringent starvation protein B
MADSMHSLSSPRPYLIRAWHEWMSDNGLTPHILVKVDATVSVPREYVRNNEVVLNVSSGATGGLNLGNEVIRFQARFAGRVREITVPVKRVASIFARENGQGMVFELLAEEESDSHDSGYASDTAGSGAAVGAASGGLTLVNKPDSSVGNDDVQAGGTESPEEPPPGSPSPAKGGSLKVVK